MSVPKRGTNWHHRLMQVRYPGSFLKLLLIGFGLVAVPLLVALVDAYLSLGKLMQHSEQAIIHTAQITRDSHALGEQLASLERLARQQLVLGDAGVLDTYNTRHTAFTKTVDRLSDEVVEPAVVSQLAQLAEQEATVWQSFNSDIDNKLETRAIVADFGAMRELAEQIQRSADDRIESDVSLLRARTESARQQLIQRLLILVPVGALLIAGVIFLIRQPIRHLAEGIRRMGEGKLDQAITVSGPRDLEELGRELDWMRLRLNEVNAEKMRFLRHVSHELKTPLTALHEGTQLLAEQVSGTLSAEQREIVAILSSNAVRLRQLIENLIDYNGIRFHPLKLHRERIDLAALVAQLGEDHKLALAARHLSMQVACGVNEVHADREKLRVVLDNLLSNAIKFAPENSTIEVSSQRAPEATVIEVADQGPGIAAEDIERLFEPFVQGAPPPRHSSSIKGTGLGLSIVRELIIAHGGEVRLLANSPHGTRVRVCLPDRTQNG